jgi:membrane protein YqaA with SNARE-associated domain
MSAEELLAALGLYAGTFVVAAVSAVVPLVAIDVFLVGLVVMAPGAALPLVVVLAAAGQLAGKLPIYWACRGVAALPGRHRARLDRVRAWLARWDRAPRAVLLASALFGLPPFSIISTAAGVLGVRARTFCLLVLAGRALRFAAIVAIAALATGAG